MTAARQQAGLRAGAAHAPDGTMGNRPRGLLPSALPPLARSCAQPRRGRAAGDGPQGRSCSGAARSRGARPFLRPHAQDAAHQRARARRHLQDAKGQRRASADGGGFNIAFEVPLYDFGRARVREAEQRYIEAVNALAEKGGQCALGSARGLRRLQGDLRHRCAIRARGAAAQRHISAETELQFNAMQIDAFALLEAARAKAAGQVASIEAKRNFWLAAADLSVAVLGGGSLSEGVRHRRRRRFRRRRRTLVKGSSTMLSRRNFSPARRWRWSAPQR